MNTQLRDYSHLKNLKGLSDLMIKEHLRLYEGYVDTLNEITDHLQSPDIEKTGNFAYSPFTELKRRYAVTYNAVYLHEFYFDQLTKSPSQPDPDLDSSLFRPWAGVDAWKTQTMNLALAGPGWVITAVESDTESVNNLLVAEHHIGWPVNYVPIVVLDMWEHAFARDYGIDKKSYVAAFFENLDWTLISKRFKRARGIKPMPSPKNVEYVHAQKGV